MLVFVFNFDLFEFSAAILEKGLLMYSISMGRHHHGLVVTAPVSSLSGLGSSPGWNITFCSLPRHFALTVPQSLYPGVSMDTGEVNAGGGGGTLRWTSISFDKGGGKYLNPDISGYLTGISLFVHMLV